MLKSFKEKYHSKSGRVWYGFEWSTAGGGEYHFIIAAYVNGATAGGGEYHFIIATYVIHISCEVEFWNNWWKFFPLIWC